MGREIESLGDLSRRVDEADRDAPRTLGDLARQLSYARHRTKKAEDTRDSAESNEVEIAQQLHAAMKRYNIQSIVVDNEVFTFSTSTRNPIRIIEAGDPDAPLTDEC